MKKQTLNFSDIAVTRGKLLQTSDKGGVLYQTSSTTSSSDNSSSGWSGSDVASTVSAGGSALGNILNGIASIIGANNNKNTTITTNTNTSTTTKFAFLNGTTIMVVGVVGAILIIITVAVVKKHA